MSGRLDVAVIHDLPEAGGAYRVLAEVLAQLPQHRFTVYTPRPEPASGARLVGLPAGVSVTRIVPPALRPSTPADRYRELWALPRRGRVLARAVDGGGHDVALVLPTELTGGSEVLPALATTPSLTYVPEPLRTAYEPEPDFARPEGLRWTLTRRGLNPFERKRIALDQRAVRAATRVVTHSDFTAAAVRDLYGRDAEVVPLGVRVEDFAPPVGATDDLRPRERRVLAIGALHPLKGHDFVIEALATIPRSRRPPLTIVGDRGLVERQLRDLAAARGVELDLRQAIPFPELVGLYHRCGVLAAGQIREPFGLVTLEAMAAELPVVAVDEGGFRETVHAGVTGLRLPRDAQQFGAALVAVLDGEDGAVAERVVAAAADVRERWGWASTAAAYERLLIEVAA
nr:glycosyltransferase [Paraconexibacter algicola]